MFKLSTKIGKKILANLICYWGNGFMLIIMGILKSIVHNINDTFFKNLSCVLYSVTVVPTPPPKDVAAYKKRGESKHKASYVIYKEFNI